MGAVENLFGEGAEEGQVDRHRQDAPSQHQGQGAVGQGKDLLLLVLRVVAHGEEGEEGEEPSQGEKFPNGGVQTVAHGQQEEQSQDASPPALAPDVEQGDEQVVEQADHQIPQGPGRSGVLQVDGVVGQNAVEEHLVKGLKQQVQIGQVEDDRPPLVHREPAGDEKEDRHVEGVDHPVQTVVPAVPLWGDGQQMPQHSQKDQDAFQVIKAISPGLP